MGLELAASQTLFARLTFSGKGTIRIGGFSKGSSSVYSKVDASIPELSRKYIFKQSQKHTFNSLPGESVRALLLCCWESGERASEEVFRFVIGPRICYYKVFQFNKALQTIFTHFQSL